MTAVRDGDSLVGTLTDIDDSHAYWIFQKNGDDIKVDIPGYKGGASSVPPVISVVEGWNLVDVELRYGDLEVFETEHRLFFVVFPRPLTDLIAEPRDTSLSRRGW